MSKIDKMWSSGFGDDGMVHPPVSSWGGRDMQPPRGRGSRRIATSHYRRHNVLRGRNILIVGAVGAVAIAGPWHASDIQTNLLKACGTVCKAEPSATAPPQPVVSGAVFPDATAVNKTVPAGWARFVIDTAPTSVLVQQKKDAAGNPVAASIAVKVKLEITNKAQFARVDPTDKPEAVNAYQYTFFMGQYPVPTYKAPLHAACIEDMAHVVETAQTHAAALVPLAQADMLKHGENRYRLTPTGTQIDTPTPDIFLYAVDPATNTKQELKC